MPSRARFGLFQFDPTTGELSREGTPIRLQRQPARVLALLLERPGEIVSRDDLRRHVWGSETFVDFERGLNFCIAQIRSALGDSADSPRYVETLPKRGYRFIAPVAAGDSPGQTSQTGSSDSSGPDAATRRARTSLPARIAATLLIALAMAVAAFVYVRQRVAVPTAAASIAVARFDNQTGSAAFDSVAEGLSDAVVVRLAQAERPQLAVVGNALLLRTARDFRDVKRIGAELNVDHVVLGQVQRDGTGVRVVAHLIRVGDERHVWANRFDRPELTLAVQGQIADEIAREVARRLQAPE
jgi:DNA-binding winged helix-turn-helix (wHTH) protein/TolB-like protein